MDPLTFVRVIAVARILMPRSRVRLSAGRADMSDELQALCFFAGANSIFYGEQLLTTPNPATDRDLELLARLGLRPAAATPACRHDSAPPIDLRQVRRSFARAAASYDGADVLQTEVRDRLLERLQWVQLQPRRMLDLGTGTGKALPALAARFPEAEIVGLDLTPAMLRVAGPAAGPRRWRASRSGLRGCRPSAPPRPEHGPGVLQPGDPLEPGTGRRPCRGPPRTPAIPACSRSRPRA